MFFNFLTEIASSKSFASSGSIVKVVVFLKSTRSEISLSEILETEFAKFSILVEKQLENPWLIKIDFFSAL